MKISVITITLNADEFLTSTIDSVAAQNYENCEHIIIDGGSTDGTLDIVREAAGKYEKLRYVSEPDRGIAAAMNKGVRLANGDVLVFLHADDFFADDSVLARVAAAFREYPSCLWITGGLRYVDNRGCLLHDLPVRRFSYRRLLRGNIILHPSTFIRRSAFLDAGGYAEGLRYAMDYDLWLRLAKITPPLTREDIYTCFRVHRGSLSCRRCKDAFREEWEVRKQALGKRNPLKVFHFSYYLLKKAANGSFIKKQLAESI